MDLSWLHLSVFSAIIHERLKVVLVGFKNTLIILNYCQENKILRIAKCFEMFRNFRARSMLLGCGKNNC